MLLTAEPWRAQLHRSGSEVLVARHPETAQSALQCQAIAPGPMPSGRDLLGWSLLCHLTCSISAANRSDCASLLGGSTLPSVFARDYGRNLVGKPSIFIYRPEAMASNISPPLPFSKLFFVRCALVWPSDYPKSLSGMCNHTPGYASVTRKNAAGGGSNTRFELWRIRTMSYQSIKRRKASGLLSLLPIFVLATGCGLTGRNSLVDTEEPKAIIDVIAEAEAVSPPEASQAAKSEADGAAPVSEIAKPAAATNSLAEMVPADDPNTDEATAHSQRESHHAASAISRA